MLGLPPIFRRLWGLFPSPSFAKGPILNRWIARTIIEGNCEESVVKADIIRSIELQLGLSHHQATLQVEQIITVIKDHLEGGDSVLISGFGKWEVREKKSRIGRSPKTLEEFEVSERRVVTFTPSHVWRKQISNNSGTK